MNVTVVDVESVSECNPYAIENLYLTTVKEHNKLHAESESIIFELYKQGIVKFNKEIGRYELLKVFEYS